MHYLCIIYGICCSNTLTREHYIFSILTCMYSITVTPIQSLLYESASVIKNLWSDSICWNKELLLIK